jgi:hypothetical protein
MRTSRRIERVRFRILIIVIVLTTDRENVGGGGRATRRSAADRQRALETEDGGEARLIDPPLYKSGSELTSEP